MQKNIDQNIDQRKYKRANTHKNRYLQKVSRWPPEPKAVGSNPSWRTRLNVVFSKPRLPFLEAFVVCMNGQMWTKRDKNRTQDRTQNRTQNAPEVFTGINLSKINLRFLQQFTCL